MSDHKTPIPLDPTPALCGIVSGNLRQLIADCGISQKKLAEQTGIAPASMTDYCNGKRLPSLAFLYTLKEKYGISIDDFVTKSIHPVIQPAARSGPLPEGADPAVPEGGVGRLQRETCRKYCGTFFTYYFDTSKYKGRDTLVPEDSLMYGIFHIYENPSVFATPEYSCAAILGIRNPETLLQLKEKIESLPDSSSIVDYIGTNHPAAAYYGDFELSQEHAFLNIRHANTDRALVILHRVDNNKPDYTGGIGTINSISKGRERMPVVQFIGFSRKPLSLSAEEIEHSLLLNYPVFSAEKETGDLLRTFQNLYMDDENTHSFTELHKALIIRSTLERLIAKSLKRNIFRYGKISERDDDEWYHMIKHSQ